MDEHRFDNLTRSLASTVSRRGGVRLLAAAGASLLALARAKRHAAAQGAYLSAGDACWDSSQCLSADAPLVCADNGFDYDGALNCCTYEGSRCHEDEHCCGDLVCGNGICRALAGGSGVSSVGCTSEGCACQQYRDPDCRASCPLYDACDPGLVCSDYSDGVCVPVSSMDGACTGAWCSCSWTPSFDPCDQSQRLVCCSYADSNQGLCLPLNEYCGGGLDPGDECASFCGSGACPICASGTCTDGGSCA